jgi:hypothetical protein
VAGEARTGPVPDLFGEDGDLPDRETAELATEVLLVPLPHTATARLLVLPTGLGPEGWTPDGGTTLGWPGDLPAAEPVARGWTTVGEGGPRIEVPDPVLADAVAAARRSLLLAHRLVREPAADDQQAPDATHVITTGADSGPGPAAVAVGEQMEVLAALAWWGHHETVDRALIDWPAGQQRGGGFGDEAATAAALRALAAPRRRRR